MERTMLRKSLILTPAGIWLNDLSYVYFEKVRIAEGKKKTPKRIRTEGESPSGLPLVDRKHVWVIGRR